MDEHEVFVFPFDDEYLPEEQQIASSGDEENRTYQLPPDDIIHALIRLRRTESTRRCFNFRCNRACGLCLTFYQGFQDFFTFADSVEQVLASVMTATIRSIHISAAEKSSEEECRRISSWAIQGIRSGATILKVSTCLLSQPLELSRELLSSCQGLELLGLDGCGIKLPEPPVRLLLPRLLELDLTYCKFEDGELQRLLASCPALKILHASPIGGLRNLEFDLPNLQDIRLTGLTTDALSFKNCPQLQNVRVNLYPPSEDDKVCSIHPLGGVLHLFHGTCNLLQSLELGRYTLKSLSMSYVPHKLGWNFKCLNYIMVRLDLRSLGELSVALCLFRSSPVLNRLDISVDRDITKVDDQIYHIWSTQQSLDCSFNELTHLSIHNLRLEYSHLEFCKFLLANTSKLMSFYVEPLMNIAQYEATELMEQLRSYDKIASSNVEIW